MLSRSAQGLYWMGRYLARAEHASRLLELQTAALVDRPVRDIYFGWARIYHSLGRLPPGGDLDLWDSSEEFTLADSYTLTDDLTFERSNPVSVWSCFALGRENARQMRHCISGEMWTLLNRAYLRIQDLRIQDIWNSPESFYTEMAAEIYTFAGVAAATMYRNEGWRFMELGKAMERAQMSTRLFLSQLAAAQGREDDSDDADWITLLRVYHALGAYNRTYSVEVEPSPSLDLLVSDPLLPDSLIRSLERAETELEGIGIGPDVELGSTTKRLAGRLTALIKYDWPDREDSTGFLRQADGYCLDLHNLVTSAYFEYPIRDHPST